MIEKFTYFDFLMYVLPGSLLEFALLGAWFAAKFPTPKLTGDGGIFGSIVFILAAFILGHFVQAIAHTFPEWLLKRFFWGRFYPSDIMFFTNQQILFAKEKKAIITRLVAENIVSEDDSKLWEQSFVTGWFRPLKPFPKSMLNDDLKKALESSKQAFYRINIFLTDSSLGKRVEVAEASYQFFKGTYTAAAISGILLISEYWFLQRSNNNLDPQIAHSLLAGSIFALLLTFTFAWRARGAGQRYAREVVRAFDAARSIPPVKTGGSQVNNQL